MHSWIFILYLGYKPALPHFAVRLFQLWPAGARQAGCRAFDTPHQCGFVPQHCPASRFILYICCPSSQTISHGWGILIIYVCSLYEELTAGERICEECQLSILAWKSQPGPAPIPGPSPGQVREVPWAAPLLLGPHGQVLVDTCGQRLTSG